MKNKTPQRGAISLLSLLLLIFLVAGLIVGIRSLQKKQNIRSAAVSNGSFSFAAVGDFSATPDTDSVLKGVASAGVDFVQSLGDNEYPLLAPNDILSRFPSIPKTNVDQQWATYVKMFLGPVKMIILAGNHEDLSGSNGSGGDYRGEVQYLPDPVGVHGDYGVQYYYDYPASNPLARFIMVSPGIYVTMPTTNPSQSGSLLADYSKGSPNYNWVATTINDARARGIMWVIVGSHTNCIDLNKSCEAGVDLYNLLLSKDANGKAKVDLMIAGHTHDYERSKQLAVNGTTCAGVDPSVFNPACIVNATATGYAKGEGTVIAIDGVGGEGNSILRELRAPAPYWYTTHSANTVPEYIFGFIKYTVTDTTLTGTFINTSINPFSDSFTITASGIIPPTPTVNATPTPQPTLTPTPSATLAPTPTATPTTKPTPTPTATPTIASSPSPPPLSGNTYYPTGDTYVNSAYASSNYSTRAYIQLVKAPTETKLGFMRFDLSSLAGQTINSAALYIKITGTSSINGAVNFASVLNWSESQVTWTNNPGIGNGIQTFAANTAGWVTIDLTQAVRQQAGQPLSLMFSTQGTSTIQFSSKESIDRPYLVIQ